MILLGMRLSPFVRKVLIHAAEKGVEMEVRPAGRGRGGPLFAEASPFGKMPALVDGDFSIADSSAIIAYVEALHPEPSLIPAEARARARTIWFEEVADTLLFPTLMKLFFNRIVAPIVGQEGDEALATTAERDELPRYLDYLDKMAPESGFLVDDRMTLADIAVGTMLANLSYCSRALIDGRWPRLAAYTAGIHARPSFADAMAAEREQMGWAETPDVSRWPELTHLEQNA